MVSRLHLKLYRDMLAARWQLLAITGIVALGVGTYYGPLASYDNLSASARDSYARLHFADAYVDLDGAPRSVLDQLRQIPGVRAVEGRNVLDMVAEQEAGRRPRVVARVITLPAEGEAPIDNVRLLEGRWLSHSGHREVMLESAFAREHGYQPGDHIFPLYRGRRLKATVVGIVASPEYAYPVRSRQFRVATPQIFGAMFVSQPELEAMAGRTGFFNEVLLLTDPGKAAVAGRAVAERLRPYGAQLPVLQEEQASNLMLRTDLKGNRPMAVTVPILLLACAGLAVALVLARWVQAQQGQVGFLRASGFSSRTILAHYLEVGVVIAVLGGTAGLFLGHEIGKVQTRGYAQLIHMPYETADPHPEIALMAVALSLAACMLGALGAARQAASISPAVAMRGIAPTGPSRNELPIRLPLLLAIPLRNLARRPLHTLGTAVGIATAVMLLILTGAFWDTLGETEAVYQRETLRYDVNVSFDPARSAAILKRIAAWTGVLRVEPDLELPVRLEHSGLKKETLLIGVPPDSRLRHLPDGDGNILHPTPGTTLLTEGLASRLGTEVGDVIHVEYAQRTAHLHAAADFRSGPVVYQPVGQPVYLGLAEMQRWFAAPLGMPPDAVSGGLLQVDERYSAVIRDRLHRLDGVAAVQTKEEVQQQIRTVFAFSRLMVGVLFMLAAMVAFMVTHTAPEIVLWLRTRELATLRTLGFSMGRITLLMSVENLTVAAAGVAMGLPLGTWLARYMVGISQTEGFRLFLHIAPLTYALVVGSTLLLAFLGQGPGLRRVSRLPLAEVIRLRDE